MGLLSAEQLATGYRDQQISENLNYTFYEGTMTNIIGPNGCGKSTFLKTLARILPSQKGTVLLNSKELNQYSSKQVARELAMLAQTSETQIDLPVFDVIAYGRYPYQSGWGNLSNEDQQIIQWALSITGLTELARESVATLSGGQRQRVWIAMALVQDTDIVILDEPTTYLDPAHQLEVLNVLKEINQTKGKTIIMTSHDINLASRFSDGIIAMKKGAILKEGTPEEVITADVLREVFQIEADIILHPGTQRPLVLSYEVLKTEGSHDK
ncbi:ABC transporter ATP-binding protein [Enterococcus olivae]